MSPQPGPAVLSDDDIQVITGLLGLIGGWLDAAGPSVGHDLNGYLRARAARLSASDLPGQIAWAAAMLRYRQITTGRPR